MNNITLDTGKLKISELQERATENLQNKHKKKIDFKKPPEY